MTSNELPDEDSEELVDNPDVFNELQKIRFHELKDIKNEIRELRSALADPFGPVGAELGRCKLNVLIRRTNHERKPFLIEFTGDIESSVRVSPIRASILLTALLDLQDRSLGGPGLVDPQVVTKKICTGLGSGDWSDEKFANNLRVAQYRFEIFLEDSHLLNSEDVAFKYEPKTFRLNMSSQRLELDSLAVEIVSPDKDVNELIERFSNSSPLAKVRKLGIAHIEGGEDGHDRFLLELFDHNLEVDMADAFYRPAIHSFPVTLLEKMGVTKTRIRRTKIVNKGLRDRRIKFVEILSKSSLEHFFTPQDGRFPYLPPDIETRDVIEHIDYFLHLVNEEPQYQLVVTEAFYPFFVASIQIGKVPPREHITLYFGPSNTKDPLIVGCLAMANKSVDENMRGKVIDWLAKHPSSVSDPRGVSEFLKGLRQALR